VRPWHDGCSTVGRLAESKDETVSLNGEGRRDHHGWSVERAGVRCGLAAGTGRQRSEVRTDVQEGNGLGGVVLAFITAVVLSFGLMLSLLHHGW
jgi:hypothetical protein